MKAKEILGKGEGVPFEEEDWEKICALAVVKR